MAYTLIDLRHISNDIVPLNWITRYTISYSDSLAKTSSYCNTLKIQQSGFCFETITSYLLNENRLRRISAAFRVRTKSNLQIDFKRTNTYKRRQQEYFRRNYT